ncbi:hypothetical protein SAMN06264365_111180 [Actinoplanes regularis]|uniref:Uncharacterized protein n=1 Tax=Actinoplanes regularis TaxID=52697 RepID=A0A239CIT3_9ACTN|nr:hypothetical protein SAMN06264365_111180 [Actinoplanes regularis]
MGDGHGVEKRFVPPRSRHFPPLRFSPVHRLSPVNPTPPRRLSSPPGSSRASSSARRSSPTPGPTTTSRSTPRSTARRSRSNCARTTKRVTRPSATRVSGTADVVPEAEWHGPTSGPAPLLGPSRSPVVTDFRQAHRSGAATARCLAATSRQAGCSMALCLLADSRMACLTGFPELRGRMRSGEQFGTRRQPGAGSFSGQGGPIPPAGPASVRCLSGRGGGEPHPQCGCHYRALAAAVLIGQ